MLYSPRVHKQCFNLVEIITALAVIAIIVTSALSLIPQGMQNNQNAVSRMAASDVGDQFLNFFASRLEYNWDELNALPSKEELLVGETTDGDEIYHTISMIMYTKVVTNPDGTVKKIPVYPSVRIYYHLENGINRSWSEYKGGDGPHSGLFHVQSANNLSFVDFDGYVRLWKEEHQMMADESGPANVHLYAEVSWPASLPYAKRTKATYDMQVYKPAVVTGEQTVGFNAPCFSAWGIDGNKLTFYTLSNEVLSSPYNEGRLVGLQCDVEAMTCAPDGSVYFVNNHSSEPSGVLYKISRGAMDHKTSSGSITDIYPIKVGKTGISNTSVDRITGLQFINNKLYGVSASSKEIYKINYVNGHTEKVAQIKVNESGFLVEGITVGGDGYVYLVRTRNNSSELWRFDAFPKGELKKVLDVKGYGACEAIAAHPTGWLFLHDGSHFIKVEPNSGLIRSSLSQAANLGDMDFFYLHELNDCLIERSCEGVGRLTGSAGLNPGGGSDFSFQMSVANIPQNPPEFAGQVVTRSDLHRQPDSFANQEFYATSIRFKPKGRGTQTDLELDGEPYTLDNSLAYTITSLPPNPPFLIRLDKKNTQGVSMGLWELAFVNVPFGTISFCDNMGGNSVDGDTPPYNALARIDSGALIPLKEIAGINFDVLGCNLWDDAERIPITVNFSVDGTPQNPFGDSSVEGNSINNGNGHSYTFPGLIQGGTSLVFSGYSWRNGLMFPLISSPTNSNVLFIHDGQALPFPASTMQSYFNNVSTVKSETDAAFAKLGYNQVLILYEFDTYDPAKTDFQDLVMLVTIKPL